MRVRHTPEQREQWHRAAQRAGMPYSDWVRETLISAALAQLGPDTISPEAQQQVEQAMAADCPHLAWVKGASGLLVCVQCRKPKALVDLGQT
jgi:hypothetical protein